MHIAQLKMLYILNLFTDCYLFADNINAGVRVFCKLFLFYSSVGRNRTVFNVEFAGLFDIALSQFQCYLELFSEVAILSNPKATHKTSSFESATPVDILKCLQLQHILTMNGKEVAMQWIPTHRGFRGNENAHLLAKQGTFILQIIHYSIPFHSVNRLI